jgi:hypothetical protein
MNDLMYYVQIPALSGSVIFCNQMRPEVGDRAYLWMGVLVKALRHKPAGRGFDSRMCYWNFSVT